MSSRAAPRWRTITCRTASFVSGETRIAVDLRSGKATYERRSPLGQRKVRRGVVSPERLQDLIDAVGELDLDPGLRVRTGIAIPDEARVVLTVEGRWFRRQRCEFLAESERDAWPGLRCALDALHAALDRLDAG